MALFMTSSLLLSGCGAAESADDRKQETEGTETVELTVWGEKDNTATLTKMIDSFKEQILQESRSTISAISTNIDTIDSIYRILISNTSVYNWLESNYADSTNSLTTAKQITSSLIMNNLWEKNYLESVYIYNKRGKQIHVSKNETSDSLITNRRIYNSVFMFCG